MMENLFEVHTLKGGQWQIDSTYREREIALDTAKQLYGEKQYQGVKVVKDTFDPRTNSSRELVIYDTSKNTVPAAPRSPAPVRSAPDRPAPKPDPQPRRHHRPPPQKSDTSVVIRAVVWLVAILVGGLLIIWGLVNLSYILERFST